MSAILRHQRNDLKETLAALPLLPEDATGTDPAEYR